MTKKEFITELRRTARRNNEFFKRKKVSAFIINKIQFPINTFIFKFHSDGYGDFLFIYSRDKRYKPLMCIELQSVTEASAV